MESAFKMIRSNMLVQAILFIAFGLFLILWPGATVMTVIYLFGALFALSGISSIISYARKKSPDYQVAGVLATGILFLVIALIAFLLPAAVASFFSVALGIILTLCGIVCIVRSFEIKRFHDNSWIATLIVGVAVTAGGIVIILNPFDSTKMFILILGVIMLVNGACELFMEYQLRRLQTLDADTPPEDRHGPRERS